MALRELLWSWWWWCSCSLVIFKAIVWWNRVIDTIWFAWWSHKAYKYIKHSVFSCYVCCLWWLSSTRHPPKGSRQISLVDRRPSAHFVTYVIVVMAYYCSSSSNTCIMQSGSWFGQIGGVTAHFKEKRIPRGGVSMLQKNQLFLNGFWMPNWPSI